ncbi:hypothetical protein PR048_018370 [Dryococelus australis]|uniref:Uncharacterized protein n=1 Tax=Dryococelus australis TaxID=614101 RepID=A0ABQ9HC91_9NEOP|nr:hypothetical protein PR048_018370 [Dryococelus australis]
MYLAGNADVHQCYATENVTRWRRLAVTNQQRSIRHTVKQIPVVFVDAPVSKVRTREDGYPPTGDLAYGIRRNKTRPRGVRNVHYGDVVAYARQAGRQEWAYRRPRTLAGKFVRGVRRPARHGTGNDSLMGSSGVLAPSRHFPRRWSSVRAAAAPRRDIHSSNRYGLDKRGKQEPRQKVQGAIQTLVIQHAVTSRRHSRRRLTCDENLPRHEPKADGGSFRRTLINYAVQMIHNYPALPGCKAVCTRADIDRSYVCTGTYKPSPRETLLRRRVEIISLQENPDGIFALKYVIADDSETPATFIPSCSLYPNPAFVDIQTGIVNRLLSLPWTRNLEAPRPSRRLRLAWRKAVGQGEHYAERSRLFRFFTFVCTSFENEAHLHNKVQFQDTNRVQSPLRIFASGSCAGRCRWSADFLGGLPFPTPLHSGADPYSPHFALTGSQDLDVKSRPNLFTHCTHSCRQRGGLQARMLMTPLPLFHETIKRTSNVSINERNTEFIRGLWRTFNMLRAIQTPFESTPKRLKTAFLKRSISKCTQQIYTKLLEGPALNLPTYFPPIKQYGRR